jgi:hypothetical protein
MLMVDVNIFRCAEILLVRDVAPTDREFVRLFLCDTHRTMQMDSVFSLECGSVRNMYV